MPPVRDLWVGKHLSRQALFCIVFRSFLQYIFSEQASEPKNTSNNSDSNVITQISSLDKAETHWQHRLNQKRFVATIFKCIALAKLVQIPPSCIPLVIWESYSAISSCHSKTVYNWNNLEHVSNFERKPIHTLDQAFQLLDRKVSPSSSPHAHKWRLPWLTQILYPICTFASSYYVRSHKK